VIKQRVAEARAAGGQQRIVEKYGREKECEQQRVK
jgi:hypothetical protein